MHNIKDLQKKIDFAQKSLQELAKSHGFERCATNEYEEFLRKNFPGGLTVEQFEAWLKPLVEKAKADKSQSGNIVTIPIVAHCYTWRRKLWFSAKYCR